jgi:hypothetical protein
MRKKFQMISSKTGPLSRGGYQWEGEGEGDQIWSIYFAYVYKNRTMKPVEIVLRSGGRRMMENDGEGEFN